MAIKQLFETYVYAQTLSSGDLLPFVIVLQEFSREKSNAMQRHGARRERLVEGEGVRDENAANESRRFHYI
ncbi:hypothetical protein [Pseudomonas sp. Z2-11]